MKLEVKVEGVEELRSLLAKLEGMAAQAVAEATEAGAVVAEELAESRAPGPYITHTLEMAGLRKASFFIHPDKDHWYYQFFETGASGHEIDGNVKKALRWVDGAEVIVARARHPGMAAEPFLRPALEEGQGKITEAMGKVFRVALERLAKG